MSLPAIVALGTGRNTTALGPVVVKKLLALVAFFGPGLMGHCATVRAGFLGTFFSRTPFSGCRIAFLDILNATTLTLWLWREGD